MKTARTHMVRGKSSRPTTGPGRISGGLKISISSGTSGTSGVSAASGIPRHAEYGEPIAGTMSAQGAALPRSGEPPRSRPRSGQPGRPGSGSLAAASGVASGRPPVLRVEQRRNIRFDKAFPVAIRSEAFGESSAIARNVSAGGIMVELPEPLPLGTAVQVFFSVPDSHARIVARGEVKNHYFLNFADPKGGLHALTGMGVRFTGFESDSDLLLGLGLTRLRTVLH